MLKDKRRIICAFCGTGNIQRGACGECGSVALREVDESERLAVRKKRKRAKKLNCYVRCLSCEWASNTGTKMLCMRQTCAYHRTR